MQGKEVAKKMAFICHVYSCIYGDNQEQFENKKRQGNKISPENDEPGNTTGPEENNNNKTENDCKHSMKYDGVNGESVPEMENVNLRT